MSISNTNSPISRPEFFSKVVKASRRIVKTFGGSVVQLKSISTYYLSAKQQHNKLKLKTDLKRLRTVLSRYTRMKIINFAQISSRESRFVGKCTEWRDTLSRRIRSKETLRIHPERNGTPSSQ